MHIEINPSFTNIKDLAQLVAETFGTYCETVIFDLTNKNNSIVHIENGHVTNRSVGDSMFEHEIECVNKLKDTNSIFNYKHVTKDGRILKTSLHLIKGEEGKAIGCFCINFDISNLAVANKAINSMLFLENHSNSKLNENSVNDILIDMVNSTLEQVGIPISYLNKEDKVELVKKLNNQGVFLIKGSVDYVAEKLCVSRYTIYNYLEEIKMDN